MKLIMEREVTFENNSDMEVKVSPKPPPQRKALMGEPNPKLHHLW